jgi:hypothetical protein
MPTESAALPYMTSRARFVGEEDWKTGYDKHIISD